MLFIESPNEGSNPSPTAKYLSKLFDGYFFFYYLLEKYFKICPD
jgi:hypothetical protein